MYSLRKSKHILNTSYSWYKKKGKTLSPEQLSSFQNDLSQIDQAIRNKNREDANNFARKLELFCSTHFKKSFFDYTSELLIALVLALAVATVVRSMWFEMYEIPTGSMRPTFYEQDHLSVTKLAFGINVPLKTEHFYFDPKLVQRSSIFIFSGANIPYIDQDTNMFWVIPYKKRYVKRCMGKPGDTLYFYGGKIYGLDKDNNFISDLVNNPWIKNIEHVPFLTFEGIVTSPKNDEILFNQMNIPIGKLTISSGGLLKGEVFNGKDWVKDQPGAQKSPHNEVQTYSDLWGIRNYAMARLLTPQQLQQDPTIDTEGLEKGVMYLELRHSPSLSYPKPRFIQEKRGMMVLLTPYTTIIPLQQHHLDAMMDNIYTARFVVEDGRAKRYSLEDSHYSSRSPLFPGVSNGTYEFYFGKAARVGWGGIQQAVNKDSSLYSHDPSNIQKLFNLGIELDTIVSPSASNQQSRSTQRYAYFRNGDLYLLGAPILKNGDPTLEAFKTREEQREQKSPQNRPYLAFKDYGPPMLPDGQIDKEFIHTFGIRVTEDHYLALGDNHAMSSDSRVFGFVPQNNLQGAPSLIIWPPNRIGFPDQKPYPIINLPRSIIWSIVLAILAIWYAIHLRNQRKPLEFNNEKFCVK